MSEELKALAKLQEQIIEEHRALKVLELGLNTRKTELEGKKKKLLALMEEAEVNSYRTASGQVVRKKLFSVKTPKGEDLQTFFGYLREHRPDDYLALATVNSQSLNSWYKQELEAVKEKGGMDVEIPGLGEPTITEQISITK